MPSTTKLMLPGTSLGTLAVMDVFSSYLISRALTAIFKLYFDTVKVVVVEAALYLTLPAYFTVTS